MIVRIDKDRVRLEQAVSEALVALPGEFTEYYKMALTGEPPGVELGEEWERFWNALIRLRRYLEHTARHEKLPGILPI